eukprot:gene2800-1785_t
MRLWTDSTQCALHVALWLHVSTFDFLVYLRFVDFMVWCYFVLSIFGLETLCFRVLQTVVPGAGCFCDIDGRNVVIVVVIRAKLLLGCVDDFPGGRDICDDDLVYYEAYCGTCEVTYIERILMGEFQSCYYETVLCGMGLDLGRVIEPVDLLVFVLGTKPTLLDYGSDYLVGWFEGCLVCMCQMHLWLYFLEILAVMMSRASCGVWLLVIHGFQLFPACEVLLICGFQGSVLDFCGLEALQAGF